jgi:hypothetical protein
MIKKIFLLYTFIFIMLISGCTDQINKKQLPELTTENPVNLSGQLNKENIDIAEPFTYTIKMYQQEDSTIKLEKLDKKLFKNLEVFDIKEEIKSYKGRNVKLIEQTYFLQPTDTENVEIPGIEVKINDKTYKLQPQKITPGSVLKEDQPLKDIHDIKPIERFFIINPWYIVVPIVGLIIIAALIFWLVKLMKKKPTEEKPQIIKEPHVLALEELAKLRFMSLTTAEEYKAYYTRLADILRTYLEGRFAIHAIEKTTEEINNELKQIQLNIQTAKLAIRVLKECDLVKFAKFVPLKEDADKCLNETLNFVLTTKIDTALLSPDEDSVYV